MTTLRSKIVRIIENKKVDHDYCEESCKFLNIEEFHAVLFLFQQNFHGACFSAEALLPKCNVSRS